MLSSHPGSEPLLRRHPGPDRYPSPSAPASSACRTTRRYEENRVRTAIFHYFREEYCPSRTVQFVRLKIQKKTSLNIQFKHRYCRMQSQIRDCICETMGSTETTEKEQTPHEWSLGNDQPKRIAWRKHWKGGVGMEFLIGAYVVFKVFLNWVKKYK